MNKSIVATIMFAAASCLCPAQSVVKIPVAQNPLFEVSTNNVAVSIPDGDSGATLGGDLVVTGGSGNYTYRWYDATNTDLGNDATLSILSPGLYYLDINDTCDCLQTIEFNVTTASIDAVSMSSTINIIPNPASGPIEISGIDAVQIAIVSMAGRMEALIVSHDGTPIHSTDLSDLARGQYIVTLTDAQGTTSVSKLIKK